MSAVRKRRPPEREGIDRYEVRASRTVWLHETRDGTVVTSLANFSARIEAVVVRDNGLDEDRRLRITGVLASGRVLPPASVSVSEFAAMGWVLSEWGAAAIVYAGSGRQDHLRAAIQLLSGDIATQRRYTAIGWHTLADGTSAYVHAGGAISAAGSCSDVGVELEGALAAYRLPDPLTGEPLRDAVRATLRMLDLAPDRVTVPLHCAIWRAALGPADFSPFLAGSTGVGKTALVALCQQHFGAEMDARHLPATWGSTANANEELAFLAKDALLVVDDFTAGGNAAEAQRGQREADRLLRAQGNGAGRRRMRADTSLRPAHPPRGLILSTGEVIPQGASLRGRLLIIELGADELRWERLNAAQRDADTGEYAAAMAAFLQYLAPRRASMRASFRGDIEGLRAQLAIRGVHARTPAAIAELALAFRHYLRFAEEAGALAPREVDALWGRAARALRAVGAAQLQHQEASDPVRRFAELLTGALTSGNAHLATPEGAAPPDAEAWGWQRGSESVEERRPEGPRIGWLSGDELYVEPIAALQVARRMAEGGAEGFAITPRALHKALAEAGALRSRDPNHFTSRHELGGVRRRVLHLARVFLVSPVEEAVPAVQAVPGASEQPRSGPVSGPLDAEETRSGPPVRSTECVAEPLRGPDGPLGPLPTAATGSERALVTSAGEHT